MDLKCIYNNLTLEPNRPDNPVFDPKDKWAKCSWHRPRTAPTRAHGPRPAHSELDVSDRNPWTCSSRVARPRRLLRTTQPSASIPRPVLARVHRSAVLASSLCHESAVSPCPQRPPAPKLHCFKPTLAIPRSFSALPSSRSSFSSSVADFISVEYALSLTSGRRLSYPKLSPCHQPVVLKLSAWPCRALHRRRD